MIRSWLRRHKVVLLLLLLLARPVERVRPLAVSPQLVVVSVSLAAHAAHVVLLAGVRRPVTAQAAVVGEALAAELAPVAIEAAMLFLVTHAADERREPSAAEGTGEPRHVRPTTAASSDRSRRRRRRRRRL